MIIWVMKIIFVQFFRVFLPPLLTISASVKSGPLLSFIKPIFAWNVPLVSLIFLKRSLVFPILLFFSISLHWSLREPFLSLLAILWNSKFKWVYLSLNRKKQPEGTERGWRCSKVAHPRKKKQTELQQASSERDKKQRASVRQKQDAIKETRRELLEVTNKAEKF